MIATRSKVAAWAHGMSPVQVIADRNLLPGIRVVHYPPTFSAIYRGDVVFVQTRAEAEAAAPYADLIAHAIVGDERNGEPGDEGPSGRYESPEAYARRVAGAIEALREAGIRWSTKGLSQAGGEFDRRYHDALVRILPGADLRATNGRVYRLRGILDGLAASEPARWSVTLLPLRLNFWPLRFLTLGSWLRERLTWPGFGRALQRLDAEPSVETIGLWCLRETTYKRWNQSWHGLVDRRGRLTEPGRIVREFLREGEA